MFRQRLTDIPLSGNMAERFFKKIKVTYPEQSIGATARALLDSRIDDGKFSIKVGSSYIGDWRTEPAKHIDMIFNGEAHNIPCTLEVYQECASDEHTIKSSFESITEAFNELYPKYKAPKDLSLFVKRTVGQEAVFFIDEKNKNTIVFLFSKGENFIKAYHLIQSFMPRLLPWFFKKKPINEEEAVLLRSLTKTDPAEYIRILADLESKLGYKDFLIKETVRDITTISYKNELNRIRNEIEAYARKMDNALDAYKVAESSHNNLCVQESGLLYRIENADTDNTEIYDWLKTHKNVQILSLSDNGILEIAVKTYISNFDFDCFDKMFKNHSSYLYKGYTVSKEAFSKVKDRERFIDEIMGENGRLKLKVRAYYKLGSGGVATTKDYRYPFGYEEYLTNPHQYFFACLGTFPNVINPALRNGDYITALEQCCISAGTINLAEANQTVRPFMEQVFNSDKKIIQMPDGSSRTPEEAYRWILEQDEDCKNKEEIENVKTDKAD